jgi:hypothetical protein
MSRTAAAKASGAAALLKLFNADTVPEPQGGTKRVNNPGRKPGPESTPPTRSALTLLGQEPSSAKNGARLVALLQAAVLGEAHVAEEDQGESGAFREDAVDNSG